MLKLLYQLGLSLLGAKCFTLFGHFTGFFTAYNFLMDTIIHVEGIPALRSGVRVLDFEEVSDVRPCMDRKVCFASRDNLNTLVPYLIYLDFCLIIMTTYFMNIRAYWARSSALNILRYEVLKFIQGSK